MKRWVLRAAALLLVAGAAHGQGYFGLYTDTTAVDCDFAPTTFVIFDVHVLYIKEATGPDGITAFQFMLDRRSDVVHVSGVTWMPDFLQMGYIEGGVEVATGGCYGLGMSIVPLGTIQMFANATPVPPHDYVRIVIGASG